MSGFARVSQVMDRPARSIRFCRVVATTNLLTNPNRSSHRVDPPGRSRFYNYDIERDEKKMIPYTMDKRSIIYVMLCIRPNVSFTLSITGRYQFNSGESHWKTVKSILKYLRRINKKKFGL